MTATPRLLVERFYYEVWNKADEAAAREILHGNFRFRASLGPERRGPDGFIDYLRAIHQALAEYTCIIDDLVWAWLKDTIQHPENIAVGLRAAGRTKCTARGTS